MFSTKMMPNEWRAIISLSSIMSLRMIGLFMVLPVFTLYALQLNGANFFLVGLAASVHGLSQALFQIPFGALSDRVGRKPIILIGLIIFALGSLLAASADSIFLMIIGRALQGMGAIGGTILATMADLTREENRTKSMAIAGMSIGFSFAIAMLIGPILTQWIAINGLFLLAALLTIIAIIILYAYVPSSSQRWHRDTEPELKSFLSLLFMPELAKLNCGIFILHAIFTASFVIIIPISLEQFLLLPSNMQWQLYLPTLLLAFTLSLILIGMAERKQQLKIYFLGSILFLALSLGLFWMGRSNQWIVATGLCFFFASFSLLEAFLPSLVSRTAPVSRKGTAMGLYSCSQFFGIFIGGIAGGGLYGLFSFTGVYLFCIMLALLWFALAYFMQPPRYLVTHLLRLPATQQAHWESIAAKLAIIPGVLEINLISEDGIAYLKMERGTMRHPDFIRLKEQLQSE